MTLAGRTRHLKHDGATYAIKHMRCTHSFALLAMAGVSTAGLSGCAPAPTATVECAHVVAQRVEATLTYPGATVLERGAHEGAGGIGAEVVPWAAQALAIRGSKQTVFSWYGSWLSAHGWSHTRDSTTGGGGDHIEAYLSDWARGDERFYITLSLVASERAHYTISPDQQLFSVGYTAPASVLGCQ